MVKELLKYFQFIYKVEYFQWENKFKKKSHIFQVLGKEPSFEGGYIYFLQGGK